MMPLRFVKSAAALLAYVVVLLAFIALGALQRLAFVMVLPTNGDAVFAANSLLTPQMIVFETLRILEAQCPMLQTVNTDWERYYAGKGPGSFKIGASLQLRKPNRYVSQDGPGIAIEDTTEPVV